MSNQSNKEIQVITNADFNGNEIKNAIIKNKQDTLVSGTNIKTINNQSILGSGNINIQGGGGGDISLNEFVITEEIFNNYKNANNYADLTEIINNETITQNVINLNNYNFFLNNLTVSNKTLLFKNGNIVFDSNGVNGTCDKAIVASSCNIGFRDCQISAINCAGTTNSLIDINNTNLTFENVIADDIKVSTTKTIIQATNTCNIKINESDIEILNNETPADNDNFSDNKITFIKILNDNNSININNSIVKINRPNNDLQLFDHKLILTAENVTVSVKITNSWLEIEEDPNHVGPVEYSNILDINLDNTDIEIINSSLNNWCKVRNETEYLLEEGTTYNPATTPHIIVHDPHTAPHYDQETFESIDIDNEVFSEAVNNEEGGYDFHYDGLTYWILNGTMEVSDLADYGITYTLNEGQSLEEGTYIDIDFFKFPKAYRVLKTFTANSSNVNEYLQAIKETVIDDTVPGIDEVSIDAGTFANTLINLLDDNDQPINSEYYSEFTYNGDDGKWYLRLYIIDEEEENIIEDYEVDLTQWGIELTFLSGYSLTDGMMFTINTESCIESMSLNIDKCINSVIFQSGTPQVDMHPYYSSFFISKETYNGNSIYDSVFGVGSIETNNLNVNKDGEYFLPINNDNLEADNVKDAIDELADMSGGGNSIPSQEGQEGKILSTNGENLEWVERYMPTLFDIKTMSEPISTDGWSCISYPTQKKLNRDDIPTAYDYLQEILDGCDKELDTLATIEQTTDNRQSKFLQCFKAGEHYVVFNGYLENPYYMKLYEAEDINDSSTWTKVNDYTVSPNGVGFIEAGDTSCYSAINLDNSDKYIVIINNEDLSMVKVLTSQIEIVPQFEFDGYFYGFANGATYRWKDSLDADEIEIELVVSPFGFLSQNANHLGKIFTRIDEHYYFNVVSDSGQGIVACRATDITDVSTYEAIGYWSYYFMDYNHWEHRFLLADTSYDAVITATTEETSPNGTYGSVPLFKFDETRPFDELNNLDLSEFTTYSVRKNKNLFYSSHWGIYILKFENNDGTQVLFLATNDLENYTKLVDGSYYNNDGITSVLYDENLLVVSDYLPIDDSSIYGRLRTSNAQRVEYTDTINGIDINYYKNGNWKICTAGQNNRSGGDTTDGKLQDVYDYLGYLNYWWIDEENEEISLQRNSNLWSMMFVGDDYKDDELPSGEYKPFALKGENSSGGKVLNIKPNQADVVLNIDGAKVSGFAYNRYVLPTSSVDKGVLNFLNSFKDFGKAVKTADSFEIVFLCNYKSQTEQYFFGEKESWASRIGINNNKVHFQLNFTGNDGGSQYVFSAEGDYDFTENSDYYFKFEFDGTKYTISVKEKSEENYTLVATLNDDTKITGERTWIIGTADPAVTIFDLNNWASYIDFAGCSIMIDGEYWWKGVETL